MTAPPDGGVSKTTEPAAGDPFATEWCAWVPTPDDSPPDCTWVEHLASGQCWDRLASVTVGRLGVLVDSAPEVYPVNFVLDAHTVVFRTDAGSKLRGVDRNPSVCFEVDGVGDATRTGWSVLVKGWAAEVDDDERRGLEALALRFWDVGPKDHWIRIRPTEVTGRRIHRAGCPDARAGSDGR